MRLLHPQYLALFLFLPPLLALWWYRMALKARLRRRLGDGAALYRSSRAASAQRDWGRFALLNLVLAALVLALAQPQWVRHGVAPELRRMDTVFIVDTSPSMRAQDVAPSRLERALEMIAAFARRKAPQDRVGLVAFSSGSTVLSYLTEDPQNILFYLDYLKDDPSVRLGTNIGRALRNALAVLAKEAQVDPRAADATRVLVLISDGDDHGAELEAAVRDAKKRAIRVHTVAIGSARGAPIPVAWSDGRPEYLLDARGQPVLSRLDERSLRWIAEETGGASYRASSGHELTPVFAEIARKEREIRGYKPVSEYHDAYSGLLFAALGLFLTSLLL